MLLIIATRGGSRIPRRRERQPSGGGRQHTKLPNFPKNCMKVRNFQAVGGEHPLHPPKSATGYCQNLQNLFLKRIKDERLTTQFCLSLNLAGLSNSNPEKLKEKPIKKKLLFAPLDPQQFIEVQVSKSLIVWKLRISRAKWPSDINFGVNILFTLWITRKYLCRTCRNFYLLKRLIQAIGSAYLLEDKAFSVLISCKCVNRETYWFRNIHRFQSRHLPVRIVRFHFLLEICSFSRINVSFLTMWLDLKTMWIFT